MAWFTAWVLTIAPTGPVSVIIAFIAAIVGLVVAYDDIQPRLKMGLFVAALVYVGLSFIVTFATLPL